MLPLLEFWVALKSVNKLLNRNNSSTIAVQELVVLLKKKYIQVVLRKQKTPTGKSLGWEACRIKPGIGDLVWRV